MGHCASTRRVSRLGRGGSSASRRATPAWRGFLTSGRSMCLRRRTGVASDGRRTQRRLQLGKVTGSRAAVLHLYHGFLSRLEQREKCERPEGLEERASGGTTTSGRIRGLSRPRLPPLSSRCPLNMARPGITYIAPGIPVPTARPVTVRPVGCFCCAPVGSQEEDGEGMEPDGARVAGGVPRAVWRRRGSWDDGMRGGSGREDSR